MAPRAEGYAFVRYRIRKDGSVDQIQVLDANEDAFADSARHALAQWLFEPMTFDGQPIASEVIMTLPFRLQGEASSRS